MPAGVGYGQTGYRRLRARGVSKAKARKAAFKRPASTYRASTRARTRANRRAAFKR